MATESLSEQVARLERSLADVTRERDAALAADATLPSSSGPHDIIAEIYRLREAERQATEAANRKAYERCRQMMIQATPLGVDEAPFEAWLSRVFPEFHPPVPPEREGARTCDCGHDTSDHYGYDAGKRGCVANQMQCACDDFRPTPPQAAPEPREVKVGRVTFAFQKARGGVWCDDQDNTSGDLVALLYLHRLTPTADEYAALLALASRPTASGEG